MHLCITSKHWRSTKSESQERWEEVEREGNGGWRSEEGFGMEGEGGKRREEEGGRREEGGGPTAARGERERPGRENL